MKTKFGEGMKIGPEGHIIVQPQLGYPKKIIPHPSHQVTRGMVPTYDWALACSVCEIVVLNEDEERHFLAPRTENCLSPTASGDSQSIN